MIFAKQALLPDGWAENIRLEQQEGVLTSITTDTLAQDGDIRVDTLLPAVANLHSHTFQRAMAGMSEHRAAGQNNFWSWRALMYRFLEHLSPDDIEAVAALAFIEMQEAGFASVAEFHYVHHQPGGMPYAMLSELSQRILAAASDTGIGLTHLPVLYTYGGAGQTPLVGGQTRFGNDVAGFAQLMDELGPFIAKGPADLHLGIAPHSLRATCPADLAEVLALAPAGRNSPVHMHIAEQPKEVADISDWLGANPVQWLLDNAQVDRNWCLIHATHMTEDETRGMARTGAVAGLCPVTEANLGDGPFNGPTYLAAGGAYGVGTDSNINISLSGELRGFEYAQRLRHLQRNVMVGDQGSTGEAIYRSAAVGGAQALGRKSGTIAPGQWADLLAIDSQQPRLCALKKEQLLDGFIFASAGGVVTDLWSAGRHRVANSVHVDRERIEQQYRRTIAALLEKL